MMKSNIFSMRLHTHFVLYDIALNSNDVMELQHQKELFFSKFIR